MPLLGSTAALRLGSTLPHVVFEDLGKTYGKIIGKKPLTTEFYDEIVQQMNECLCVNE